MVRQLQPPHRPLPPQRSRWTWTPRPVGGEWQWCRIYHRSLRTPDGITFRRYGPLYRFDHHREANPPGLDDSGRRILYVGADMATSGCEVFGEAGVAAICPRYRIAIVSPVRPIRLFDLTHPGAAMGIGALPAVGDGNEPRGLTQQWSRAIFEDQPAGPDIEGMRYRTAYNHDDGLALWDCDDAIEVVRDAAGRPQDLPLDDVRMLARFQPLMLARHIAVTTVSSADCGLCSPASSGDTQVRGQS